MFHPSLQTDSGSRELLRAQLLGRGYVSLPSFLSPAGVEALEAELAPLIASNGKGVHFVLRDPQGAVILMNRIDNESDFLFDFARHPTMLSLASDLLGKPALSLHVEYFAKPAGSHHSVPPHQDHVFYRDHFGEELAISFWIALDEVVPESGALEYACSSPLALVQHVPSSAPDFDFELADSGAFSFVAVPASRGACVVHHSYAIHRSGPNSTARWRRAVVFNYRGSDYRTWLRARGKPG